jgi:hypothetical protein
MHSLRASLRVSIGTSCLMSDLSPHVCEVNILSTRDVYYTIFCRYPYCTWRGEAGPALPPNFDRKILVESVEQMEKDHMRISHPPELFSGSPNEKGLL